MSSCEFTIDDNDLKKDIQAFYSQYPSEAVSCLQSVARQFNKDVNKKFPDGGTTGGTKSVKKKWKVENDRCLGGLTYALDDTNYAPHFHLVENGHELYMSKERYAAYKAGKLTINGQKSSTNKSSTELVHAGFVPGKHYCADTRDEYKAGRFQTLAAAKIYKAMEKHDL